MKDWFEQVAIWLGLAFVVAVCGYAAVEAVQTTRLERFCLAHGYSRADWRVIGENYCITRTDQTDVVVPTSQVK